MHERHTHLLFLINVFRSLETEMVSQHALKLLTLYMWASLSPPRLRLELHQQPDLATKWASILKREKKAAAKKADHVPLAERKEAVFFP